MRTVRTIEDLQGAEQVTLEPIDNIVPYILEYVKDIIPEFNQSWNFLDEEWFPMFVQEVVNFEKACVETIGVFQPDCFYGSYYSDEVHRYKLLWFRGKYVAINFMVGDTTSSTTLWFNKGDKARILSDLMTNFPADFDEGEVYSEVTGKGISNSQYLQFVKFNGDVWAVNQLPNYGGLVGKDSESDPRRRLIEIIEMPILDETSEVCSIDHGACEYVRDHQAGGYDVFKLRSGRVVKTAKPYYKKQNPQVTFDDGEFIQIEKVMDLPKQVEVVCDEPCQD